jgi:hypothetical protein
MTSSIFCVLYYGEWAIKLMYTIAYASIHTLSFRTHKTGIVSAAAWLFFLFIYWSIIHEGSSRNQQSVVMVNMITRRSDIYGRISVPKWQGCQHR